MKRPSGQDPRRPIRGQKYRINEFAVARADVTGGDSGDDLHDETGEVAAAEQRMIEQRATAKRLGEMQDNGDVFWIAERHLETEPT